MSIGLTMFTNWVKEHDRLVSEHKAACASDLKRYLVRYESDNGRTACKMVKAANEEAARWEFNQSSNYAYIVIEVEKQ